MKNQVKLDKKDSLLLIALDRDSRRSYSSLSKRLSMPIETIRYRTQRLLSSGAVKNFLAVVDGGRLGFYYYKVFFRLHNIGEKKINQIITELSCNPQISWVIRVDGNYDIGFTPRVSSPTEQSELLDKLRWKYSEYIRRWTLSVNIRMDFFARDFLTGSKTRAGAKGSYTAQKDLYKLDQEAQIVLDELSKNPRASATEIAKDRDFSADTASDRIRRLEKNKVIVRYSLVTDTKLLGHTNVYVLVYLNHVSPEREKEFVDYCSQQSNIIYLIKSLGEWDYELSIEALSIQDYRELMMRLNSEFSDIIQEYNGLMVDEVAKYVYP
ncbi:MAG: winged helix-turn-helix transcriptional regulator [Bdellovibrionota bacterium]